MEIDVNHNLKKKKSFLWELNDDADVDQIDDDDGWWWWCKDLTEMKSL